MQLYWLRQPRLRPRQQPTLSIDPRIARSARSKAVGISSPADQSGPICSALTLSCRSRPGIATPSRAPEVRARPVAIQGPWCTIDDARRGGPDRRAGEVAPSCACRGEPHFRPASVDQPSSCPWSPRPAPAMSRAKRRRARRCLGSAMLRRSCASAVQMGDGPADPLFDPGPQRSSQCPRRAPARSDIGCPRRPGSSRPRIC